jgi:hypothetical protein
MAVDIGKTVWSEPVSRSATVDSHPFGPVTVISSSGRHNLPSGYSKDGATS